MLFESSIDFKTESEKRFGSNLQAFLRSTLMKQQRFAKARLVRAKSDERVRLPFCLPEFKSQKFQPKIFLALKVLSVGR